MPCDSGGFTKEQKARVETLFTESAKCFSHVENDSRANSYFRKRRHEGGARAQMLKQLAQPACDISREQWDVGFEGLLRHLNIDVVVVNVILPPEKRAVYDFAVGWRPPGADGGGAETFIERS